eukprot:scaffold110294_cov21-Tisochrysis_lutea.AAC.3
MHLAQQLWDAAGCTLLNKCCYGMPLDALGTANAAMGCTWRSSCGMLWDALCSAVGCTWLILQPPCAWLFSFKSKQKEPILSLSTSEPCVPAPDSGKTNCG